MAPELPITIPLIINGIDVFLSDETLKFTPQSISNNLEAQGSVRAQGADIASCHAAVDSCARAFETWRQTSTIDRRRLFLRLAELLRSRGEEIKAIIEAEIHATPLWAAINVEESISMIEEAASLITSPVLSGTLPPSQDPESQVLVLTEPLGVILGIAPWNSPLILGFRSVLAAIAVGNTAILKGSELSPRTHYLVASLFREAGFPPGVCNFLLHRDVDAPKVFEAIIDRHEVRKCNFTGSTAVGRSIASRAAKALKPCLMELGGKNFAIVLEDADVEKAARLVAEGAFLYNGQICMSTETVLVAAPVFDSFKSSLLSILRNPSSTPAITRMITTKSAARIRDIIADAIAKGATIHTTLADDGVKAGGDKGKQVLDFGKGTDVPAIVIEGLNSDMDLYQQESFGPLLSITPVKTEDEAISTVNQCRYGLSAALHTKDHYSALVLAKKLKVAAIHINGSTVHDENTLPHGGHGDSGWGRFGAGWGLLEFVQTKTVVINK